MSTARPQARREAGFTIFETMITIGILAIMILIVQATIDGASRAERRLQAVRQATERGEAMTYDLLAAVNASRLLFQGDGVGDGYLAALDLAARPLLTGARLPRIGESTGLEPDTTGDPQTGNILLFARESDALEALANPGTGATRYVDLYRLVCAYPTQTTRNLIMDPPVQAARDLVLWRSVRYADLAQLQGIEDPDERRNVVIDLVENHDCHFAWDLGAPVASAFYELGDLGGIDPVAVADMLIDEDPDSSEGGRLVYADVQLAPTRAEDFYRRALMSADDPTVWRPEGLEIKITGPSGARKVWIHVVVEAPQGKGVVGVQACTIIAHPRDL